MRTLIVLIAITRVAAAQPAGNMQLDDFHPAMDARGYLTLNGSETLDHEELSFGLGSLEWGRHLLAFSNGSATYSVDNVVSATLVGAMGLRLGSVPLEVGASLPLSIMNGTHDRVDGQGLGDLGVHVKARLLHAGALGIGVVASVYLPTATPSDRFLGDAGITPQLVGIADVALGRVRLAVNGGVRLRPTATFTDTMMGTMGTITTSTELPLGAGAAWALAPEKVELVGEVFGAVPVGAHENYQPLEALGGMKVYLAKNSYMAFGAGRGIAAGSGSPDLRAFIGIVFEPKPAPVRAARFDDEVVVERTPPKPPEEPADRDGDGVLDKDDKCPDEPGPAENQGCPKRELVDVTDSEIVPLRSIDFEFDSATLKQESLPVLDSVVDALQDHQWIARIEVQGHTDERGSDAYNQSLSERRAAAVMQYLSEHGIPASRLESHGYGRSQPIDLRHNEQAWQKNRRVEFVIKERSR